MNDGAHLRQRNACAAWLCALFLLAAAEAGAQAAVDPVDGKQALIARILRPPPSPWAPSLPKLVELMADTPTRRLFKSLSSADEWGPGNPRWRSALPAFRSEYLKLVLPDPVPVEAELASRLHAAMDEEELSDLLAMLANEELDQLLKLASRLGLQLDIAARTANLSAAPELYSAEEVSRIEAELVKLQGREAEMQYVAWKMQSIRARFERPVFAKYQKIMVDLLQPIAAADNADAEFRARFEQWLGEWRGRIGR